MRWDRFDEVMESRNWQQVDLADLLGVRANKISKWKRGEIRFLVTDLLEIARRLEVSPGWLLGEPRFEDLVSEKDQLVLQAVREIGHEEAMRRIVRQGQSHTGGIDPTTGAPVPPKRKGAG